MSDDATREAFLRNKYIAYLYNEKRFTYTTESGYSFDSDEHI